MLVLVVTLLLLASVAFLGFRSFMSTKTAIKDEFNELQLVLAEGTARGIEQYLETLVDQLRIVSNLPDIRTFSETNSEALLNIVYNNSVDEGVNSVGMLDADGILRFAANSPPSLIGTDFSYRNYFREAKKSTSPNKYFIEFIEFQGTDLGKKGVLIAVPIYEKERQTIFKGVILVTVPLEHVTRTFLKPLNESHAQHVFLIDKKYSVLWSPDKSQFGRNILRASKELPDFQNMIKKAVSGKKGLGELAYLEFDKTKKVFVSDTTVNTLFAYMPVSLGNQEWFIALWAPEKQVLKLANSSFLYLVTVLGFASFIILLFASSISMWIVRSTERLRKRQVRSEALSKITDEMSSTLDVDEILERVAKSANTAMGCDTTVIGLIEGDNLVIKYSYGLMKDQKGTKLTVKEARAGAGVATSGKPIVINDAFNDPRIDSELARKFSIRSFLGVPIVIKGKSVGTLAFHQNIKPKIFAPEDIDFSYRVATSVSIALDNAELFKTEQNIADTLQTALLGVPDAVQGLDFGYIYKSATAVQARVGGDFYDLFELHNHRVGILVGDVSGKGPKAASLTAMIKNTIKAFAQDFESPAQVLGKTNDLCIQNIDPSMFVTVWFGILDVKTGSLVYSNAGHPLPLVKKMDGGYVFALEGETNLPLGVLENREFSEERSGLKEEEIMILFTDGVFEARLDKSLLGWDGLTKLIDGLDFPLSPETLPSLIIEEIVRARGYELVDDVVIMVISRNGETRPEG